MDLESIDVAVGGILWYNSLGWIVLESTWMTRIIEAIYENGSFKPLGDTTGIGEHAHARVLVCEPGDSAERARVRGTISPEEAANQMLLIDREFGRVEGDW